MRLPQRYRPFAIVKFYTISLVQERNDMSEATSNKPVQVLRRRGVKVSIFANHAGEATFHKIAIQKVYRDDQQGWKTTNSLGRDDLPVAALLLSRAWEWILDQEGKPDSGD